MKNMRIGLYFPPKMYRLDKWKKGINWQEMDLDEIITSKEAIPEAIQDFGQEMVIIGGDVVSLYPNLKIEDVAKDVKEALLQSKLTWQNVDYQEAVRYIALNISAEECARSPLRRLLPWRRGKTEPGLALEVKDHVARHVGTRSSGAFPEWC